jgi:hypothetical protein
MLDGRTLTPDSPFLCITIQMDDAYIVTTREVFTISNAFANTGGFMSVIYLIVMALMHRIKETMYNA